MGKKPILNSETYCIICSKQLKTATSFKRHMKFQHRSKSIHECILCEESFAKVEQLVDHIHEHNKNKLRPFECNLCMGSAFEDVKSLESHVISHIGSEIIQQNKMNFYDCSECAENFKSLSLLCVHRKDFHVEQKYQCSQCEAKFTRSEDLHTHSRIHRGLQVLKCFCTKLFASPKYLAAHIRRLHPGKVDDSILLILDEEVPVDFTKIRDWSELLPVNDQKFTTAIGGDGTLFERCHKCPFCALIFVKATTVGVHIKRCHADIKISFQTCSLCNKSGFQTRETLLDHFKIAHEAEKPFRCQCGLKFVKVLTLLDHVNFVHQHDKFRCEYCGLFFQRQTSLYKHYKKHENPGGEVFLCNICQIPYVNKKGMLRHMRLHQDGPPHQCSYCEKRFVASCDKKKHERIHTNEKPFKCDKCEKVFTHATSWKKHELVHSKERTLICNICGKGFLHKSNLKVHFRIHTDIKTLTMVNKWIHENTLHLQVAQKFPLTLENCVISAKCPPFTVFKDTKRSFAKVVIKNTLLDRSEFCEFLDFFQHIGEYTEVITCDCELEVIPLDFFTHFPILRKIEFLKTCPFEEVLKYDIPQTVAVLHFKYFVVSSILSGDRTFDLLQKKRHISVITAKYVEVCQTQLDNGFAEDLNDPLKVTIRLSSGLFDLVKNCRVSHIGLVKGVNLLKIDKLDFVDVLKFKHTRASMTADIFQQYIGEFSQISALQQLTIDAQRTAEGCFFTHDIVPFDKLRKLFLTSPTVCKVCLENLTLSCPNLDNLEIYGFLPEQMTIIEGLPKPLRKLKLTIREFIADSTEFQVFFPSLVELNIIILVSSGNRFHLCLDDCPQMPLLRKICLSFIGFGYEDLESLVSKCPVIEEFYHSVSTNIDDKKLKLIENCWPELKKLEYWQCPNGKSEQLIDVIDGKFRKLRSFVTSGNYPVEMSLYRKIPMLRQSDNYSYADFCVQEFIETKDETLI